MHTAEQHEQDIGSEHPGSKNNKQNERTRSIPAKDIRRRKALRQFHANRSVAAQQIQHAARRGKITHPPTWSSPCYITNYAYRKLRKQTIEYDAAAFAASPRRVDEFLRIESRVPNFIGRRRYIRWVKQKNIDLSAKPGLQWRQQITLNKLGLHLVRIRLCQIR